MYNLLTFHVNVERLTDFFLNTDYQMVKIGKVCLLQAISPLNRRLQVLSGTVMEIGMSYSCLVTMMKWSLLGIILL